MIKMTACLTLLGLLLALTSSATLANRLDDFAVQSDPVQTQLIEMFSSQGCSSCPPAQRWLSGYAKQPGLWRDFVPVVFHVTYWDYLGWRDPYGQRQFSRRQYQHLNAKATRQVYTPQFVVSGREWRGWFAKPPSLSLHQSREIGVISLEIKGTHFSATFVQSPSHQPLVQESSQFYLALVGSGLATRISSGENHDKVLKEDFTVLSYGHYDGKRQLEGMIWQGDVPVLPETAHQAEKLAWVAWVEESKSMPLQAVGGWITDE